MRVPTTTWSSPTHWRSCWPACAPSCVAASRVRAACCAWATCRSNLSTREGQRGERTFTLTRIEFDLLEMFLRHPRQVLTREVLLNRVWGFDFDSGTNSLAVYVGYLRRKLEEGGEPRCIQTVRGVGYVLRDA